MVLLGSWVEAGQDPAYFWRLTPRESGIIMDAAVARLERERQLAAWTAWTNAALVRTAFHAPKKFPKLEKIMPSRTRKPVERQTWQQQQSIARTLNALFGGTEGKRHG